MMAPSPDQSIVPSPVAGLGAVIMAAGLGTRMRSKLAKVLHPVAGRPMVLYAVELADRIAGAGTVVVAGHQASSVTAVLDAYAASRDGGWRGAVDRAKGVTANVKPSAGRAPSWLIAEQPQQLGTGHAVMQARAAWLRARGTLPATVLILNGDTPLLTETTVRALIRRHEEERAAVTVLTARMEDPAGYGRVIRDPREGRILRIVEDRDAGEAEAQVREINVGTYVMAGSFLGEALDRLAPTNAQREYYLTDIVALAVAQGLRVSASTVSDANEGLGINDRRQLAEAERTLRQAICARWMTAGVTIQDPATTSIDAEVAIGCDTVLYPHVRLEGRTQIGEDCTIRSYVRISDSRLGVGVVVQDHCVIQEARLDDGATAGPFARLRPGSRLRAGAKVGNFVEMKKADIGEGSKANHLAYLGDAKVGRNVNIGAGTITCNYDGANKWETVIEDGVFVGSDTQLIAPVTVGKGAVIAAGSTITADVPADALAIARATQVNRAGWAARRRALQADAKRETLNVKREASNVKRQTLDMKRAEKSNLVTRHPARITGARWPVAKGKMSGEKGRTGKLAKG